MSFFYEMVKHDLYVENISVFTVAKDKRGRYTGTNDNSKGGKLGYSSVI